MGGGGQKPSAISPCGTPVFRPFQSVTSSWPKSIVFGQAEPILLQRDLSGRLTCTGLLQGLPVVPGHPRCWILRQLSRVFLQLREVVERIGVIQFAGMDQAHEQIPHLGAVLGLIEQTILAATESFP